jgi:hypothetical protein
MKKATMTGLNKFTDHIEEIDEINLVIDFVTFLCMVGAIGDEASTDVDNYLHDNLAVCPECCALEKSCSCLDGDKYNPYDDEASFE